MFLCKMPYKGNMDGVQQQGILKQEAHGPHCSHKKTVQINKHMIIIMFIKRIKKHYLLYEIECFLI